MGAGGGSDGSEMMYELTFDTSKYMKDFFCGGKTEYSIAAKLQSTNTRS